MTELVYVHTTYLEASRATGPESAHGLQRTSP